MQWKKVRLTFPGKIETNWSDIAKYFDEQCPLKCIMIHFNFACRVIK